MIRVARPIPFERVKLLVFDLDGTLIDSSLDLAHSVNAMLAHFGKHALPEEVIASYIGDGAGMLVRRALGDPDDQQFLAEGLEFFLSYYREHKLDNTYVYPGVFDSLHALAPHYQMAVLTNKPVGASLAICSELGLARFFFQIYGGNSFSTKKPDPAGLEALMRDAEAAPDETVMVGDSDVDVATARSIDAWAVGCTFGLAPDRLHAAHPDVTVDSAAEWAVALQKTAQLSR